MAVSIYDKVLPWDPINYFSIESNLGKDRLDRRQKQADDLSKMQEVAIPHGPATRNIANKLQTEVVNPALDDITKSIQAGEDPFIIAKKKRSLQQSLKENPLYWAATNDHNYNNKRDMWGVVATPEHASAAQDYYIPGKGFDQWSPDKGTFDPQSFYSDIPLVGLQEDPGVKDLYTQIKPFVEKYYGQPFRQFTTDPNTGEITGAFDTYQGTQTRKIDRAVIKNALQALAYNDPNFVDQYPSLRRKRWERTQEARKSGIEDYEYLPENVLDDLADAYIGQFSSTEETAPMIKNVPGYSTSKTKGKSGDTDVSGLQNVWGDTIDALYANGRTKAPVDVLTSAWGASDPDKDGKFKANLAGSNTIIRLSEIPVDDNSAGYGEEQRKINDLSALVKPLGVINSLRKKYGVDYDEPNDAVKGTANSLDYTWSYDKTNIMTSPQEQEKWKKLKSDPSYKAALQAAREYGYDLTKKDNIVKVQSELQNVNSDIKPEALSLISDKLGEVELMAGDNSNIFIGNDGSPYVTAQATIKDPSGELGNALISAVDAGIATVNVDDSGDTPHTYYTLPVVKKVNKNSNDITTEVNEKYLGEDNSDEYNKALQKVNADKLEANRTAMYMGNLHDSVIDDINSNIQMIVHSGKEDAESTAERTYKDLTILETDYQNAVKSGNKERIQDASLKLATFLKVLKDYTTKLPQ